MSLDKVQEALATYGDEIRKDGLSWMRIAQLTGLSEFKARQVRTLALAGAKSSAAVDKFAPRSVLSIVDGDRKDREIAKLKSEIKSLAAQLGEAGSRQEVIEALASPVPTVKAPPKTAGGRAVAAAVLMLSDTHFEATVDPASVNYMNAYNEKIARLRTQRFIDGAKSLIEVHRSKADIRTVVLGIIGDVVEGWIHEELMVTNWTSPLGALQFAEEMIVHVIDSLLADEKIEHLSVPCQIGNHGRLTHKKAPGIAIPTSLEWYLYAQIAKRYKGDSRVAIGVPEGLVTYTEVFGYTLRWEHGDSFRSQGGIGGLTIPFNKLIHRRDQDRPADMTHIGHYHTYTPSSRSIVNGSLKGYDPYALSLGLPFERAVQASYILDRANGPHSLAPLWCQRKDDVFKSAAKAA